MTPRNSASREAIARRQRRNWMLVFAVCTFIIGIRAVSLRAPMTGAFAAFSDPQPLVIAHRGGAGVRPGNTMLAFQHAADLGVDVLELDAQLSSDGVLVAMHDTTVDRTTDGSGAVSGLTLAALRRLDAAYHWRSLLPAADEDGAEPPYRGRGIRIPTVKAVLERFPDLRFNIELKTQDPAAAATLCELLRGTATAAQTLVASAHDAALRGFREACPEVATSAGRREVKWFVVYHYLRLPRWYDAANVSLQLPFASAFYRFDDPSIYESAARTGRSVHLWTLNDTDQILAALAAGAQGIITDLPEQALAARQQWQDRAQTPTAEPRNPEDTLLDGER